MELVVHVAGAHPDQGAGAAPQAAAPAGLAAAARSVHARLGRDVLHLIIQGLQVHWPVVDGDLQGTAGHRGEG